MSFFFIMGKSEFHFNADAVYKKDISNEAFQRKPKLHQGVEGKHEQSHERHA
jgi:hypothetical protein